MKKLLIFILAAITLAGCSKDETVSADEMQIGQKKYKLIVRGDKEPDTKALAVEDRDGKNFLVSSWETTDKIYVHKDWVDATVGYLSPNASGKSADLAGTLTGDFVYDDHLFFTYPAQITDCDYTEQDGTLETIAKKYDYITADGYVKSVEGNNIILQNNLSFKRKQAIIKFILMDKQGNPVYPERLTLKGYSTGTGYVHDLIYENTRNAQMGTLEVNIDQSTPHNEIYVALKMADQTATTFEVRGYGNFLPDDGSYAFFYDYNKTSGTKFEDGKYYEIKVKMNAQSTVNPDLSNFNYNFDVLVNNSAERLSEVKHLFIFFNNVSSGYLKFTRSGNNWIKEMVGNVNPNDLLKNGTVTAVSIPRLSSGDDILATPSNANGEWKFGNGLKGMRFLGAEKVQYNATVTKVGSTDMVTLSGTINLQDPDYPDDVGEFVLRGSTPGGNSLHPLFASNKFKPYGLVSISDRGDIEQMNAKFGDWTNAVDGWVYGDFEPNENICSYYALQTNVSGTLTYYHYYDPFMVEPSLNSWDPNWIQVGPGCTVDFGGTQWWSTNLKADHTPEAHPWVAALITWRMEGHTSLDSGIFDTDYALSNLSFNFVSSGDSRLPSETEFQNMLDATDCYPVHICGVDGALFVSKSDKTKYLYLIYVGEGDYFYAFDPRASDNPYEFINKGRYWIKDYDPQAVYHWIDGVPSNWESFYWVKSFRFDINNLAARGIEDVPERPTWTDDHYTEVYFFWLENTARPVKK